MNLIVKLAAAGLAATTAAGGGAALASPAASAPPITACYKTGASSAPLQRVAGATCPAGTTRLTWSQQGPAGPVGPTGPAGAAAGLTASVAAGEGRQLPGAALAPAFGGPAGSVAGLKAGDDPVLSRRQGRPAT